MKAKQTVSLLALAMLIGPASAQAHVSLHPNTIPAGAFATLRLRVPAEQEGAHVTKVETLLPAGFTSVDYASVPGWKVKVLTRKLARPVQSEDGPIDTEVSRIVWSWVGPEGRLDAGQFVEFPLSIAMPDADSGKGLAFKTVESYSNGKVDHWIGPSSAEEPAPTINVTAKGGAIEDLAGEEAGPDPGQRAPVSSPSATATNDDGASRGLAIAALALGALGLLVGGRALRATKEPPAGA